jgi:hypothetical protein
VLLQIFYVVVKNEKKSCHLVHARWSRNEAETASGTALLVMEPKFYLSLRILVS